MREVTSRALGVGLALGIVGIVGAGAVANAVGPREFHTPGEEHEEEAPADEEAAGTEFPEGTVGFVAVDIDFAEAPTTVPAGAVELALVNEGNAVHNVAIDGEVIVEAQGGETATGSFEAEAGQTYSYICSIPGHAATMNGEFTVEG